MQITFGFFLDGANWSSKSASIGELTCGPEQFLTLLEQKTGSAGIRISHPERINQYMQKIADAKHPWCRESFQLDNWSTAKQLLAMRDELCLNGWNKSDDPSERLKALAQIEASPLPLSPGEPDRLQKLLDELENFTFSDTLILQDDFSLLPFYWQKIIKRLETQGMHIVYRRENISEKKENKIIKISGSTEYILATELARYLSSGDNKKVAVISEDKSDVLDGVLHRFDQGMIGSSLPSRWRESLQILPLWLETMWKPFNPLRFLELLTLSCSPIPKVISRNLIAALQKNPGIGGERWQHAWEKTLDTVRENKNNFYKDVEAECKKINDLKNFLENECFNNETGVLEKTLIKRCEYLEKRLAPQIGNNPALAIVVSHIQTLKKIVPGKGIINRVTLARMLDSIVSTGTKPDIDKREVTDFTVFAHPGMVTEEFDTVLWWNCVDKRTHSHINWTPAEIAVLPGYNRNNQRKLESSSWKKAEKAAKKEFIVFIPRSIAGEAVYPHALLDEPEMIKVKTIDAQDTVDDSGKWNLGSRNKQLSLKPQFQFAGKKVKSSSNDVCFTRQLSFSQLETFLSCPFQWFMKDFLALQMPPLLDIPSESAVLGTLAHKVVEILYCGRERISENEARNTAGEIFDNLLPVMAAELLLPGKNSLKNRLKNVLKNAIYSLVKHINSMNLMVKACEKELHGSFEGTDFIGYCDLYLEDENGKPFVIDMKWSTYKKYENSLKDDTALQLATYSWLLSPEQIDVQCAYYLFPTQKLLYKANADWKTLWQNAHSCWVERMTSLRHGILEKGSDNESELKNSPLPLPLAANCRFCNFSALCQLIEE